MGKDRTGAVHVHLNIDRGSYDALKAFCDSHATTVTAAIDAFGYVVAHADDIDALTLQFINDTMELARQITEQRRKR